jgi:uncharacterized protein
MNRLLSSILVLAALWLAQAHSLAETMPAKPAAYFNDYAKVTDAGVARRLNEEMAGFERSNGCQIVAAIFPKMESQSDISDYTRRIADNWGIGQKGQNNGVGIFVFIQDHKSYIQVGYGLEGRIPDITAKHIIEREMVPEFRAGRFTAGMEKTVRAVMAAARGEYKGTGRTVAESGGPNAIGIIVVVIFLVAVLVILLALFGRRGIILSGSGGGWSGSGWSSGWGSGSSSGWGSGSGSGSGFSGGGGSFGGGGAGGSW